MLTRIFPFLGWFKGYTLESFRIDAIAGLTVALVLVPQSMAYAQLAGLPPYYGLYASFLPPMIASLFGSSRQLATGPVAMVSLMTSASLAPLATAGSSGYVAYAIVLAFTVGVFQLALGLFRLGVVINFLSHPVVNGFTNAAAIIIASSQLSKLFGVTVDSAEHHYETIYKVCIAAWHYTHWPTLVMGIFAFVIMYGLRKISPKIPNVLVAVALTILISWAIGFEHNATVKLAEIESEQIHKLIEQYNLITGQIPQLGEERSKLSNQLELAKTSGDKFAELDAQRDLAVVNTKIAHLKIEAGIYRKQLRSLLLALVQSAENKPVYILKDQSTQSIDGRTWRIKVGDGTINPQAISMIGGGSVVGTVPEGLPSLTVPELNLKVFVQLFPYAIIISLLGFMEAISIAKAMAVKTGQRLDPNQELIGQGIANILGAIGKSYPTSGSFSRSAVNLQAGAVTGLSSVFTSITVVIVLLFLTPLLYHLPQAVLAAVIMMAVIGLINVSGFIHAWRVQWYDGLISIISFIATLVFAPHLDKGIILGVLLSLVVFLYKSMRPKVVSLSKVEGHAFRSAFDHQLAECRYVDLVRFDGPVFFANASFLEDKISERLQQKKELKHIVIAANGISDIDASGEEVISLVIDRVRGSGMDISFSGLNESVVSAFKRTHLFEKIGEDHIYPTMEQAICAVQESAHQGGVEIDCPLTTVCRLTFGTEN